jgi:hypothetical protein
MRVTRGLLASLGASTSLVLAAAVALFSVSTIVAFRGWPGIDPTVVSPESERIAVSAASAGGAGASHMTRIVIPRAPARPRRQVASSSAPSVPRSDARAPVVVSRPARSVRRNLPVASAAPRPQLSPPATAESRPKGKLPAPADPVRQVGSGLGGAVGGVAGGLGEAVRPVSPALGRTLDQAGRSLEQTISGVTGAVSTLLDGVFAGSAPG